MNLQASLLKGRELGENLKFILPSAVKGKMGGAKLGKNSGTSLEFRDYREYQPGDDIRRIDWRAYARSDKYVLKLYQEEIQPVVSVLSDVSTSMEIPDKRKAEAAIMLSGIILSSAISADCALSWWTFGSGIECVQSMSKSFPDNAPKRIAGKKNLFDELVEKAEILPKRGLRIVISDFLWDISPASIIQKLAKTNCSLILLCVLSNEEMNPSINGIMSLSDSENGGRLDIEISARERELYKERLSSHLSLWKEDCVRAGAIFQTIITEDILSGQLSGLLQCGLFSV